MNKHKNQTSIKTNCDNFLAQSMKNFANKNYKATFKIATTELHDNKTNPNFGKKQYGCNIHVTQQKSSLPYPSDKQI